jgi:tetratricopeptide (TPR) repeat protein
MRQKIYTVQFTGTIKKGSEDSNLSTRTSSVLSNPIEAGETKDSSEGEGCIDYTPLGFKSEMSFINENSFKETGTLYFSNNARVYFSTVGAGHILSDKISGTKQGLVVWKLECGEDQPNGISGLIMSNFSLLENGEFVDDQVGQILLENHSAQPSTEQVYNKQSHEGPKNISLRQIILDIQKDLKEFRQENQPKTESKSKLAKVADHFTNIKTIFFSTLLILVSTLLGLVIISESTRDVLQIEPFDIPPILQEKGFSSRVLANRLVDKINDITEKARTNIRVTPALVEDSVPNIEVPETGISLRVITRYLKGFIGSNPKQVNGNVTNQGTNLNFSIRLMKDRSKAENSSYETFSGTLDDIDTTMGLIAQYVLKETAPYILASYYYEIRHPDALNVALYCLKTEPDDDDAWAFTLWGLILDDNQDYEAAIEKYQQAIATDPKVALAYLDWGLLLEKKKKDYKAALAKYEEAANVDPKCAMAFNNWGYILLLNGDTNGAIPKFEHAITLDPEIILPYQNLANIKLSENRPKEANTYYEIGAAKNSNSERLYNDWGLMLLDQTDYPGAIAKFTKAIELGPKYSYAYNNRGYTLAQQGTLDEALIDYKMATELDPKYVMAYVNWGYTLIKKRDYRQAINKFRKAVELDQTSLDGYFGWADALRDQKKYKESAIIYQKIIKIDGEGEFGLEAKKELEKMQSYNLKPGKKK